MAWHFELTDMHYFSSLPIASHESVPLLKGFPIIYLLTFIKVAGITGTVALKMTSLRMRWSHWAKRERWEKGEIRGGKGRAKVAYS